MNLSFNYKDGILYKNSDVYSGLYSDPVVTDNGQNYYFPVDDNGNFYYSDEKPEGYEENNPLYLTKTEYTQGKELTTTNKHYKLSGSTLNWKHKKLPFLNKNDRLQRASDIDYLLNLGGQFSNFTDRQYRRMSKDTGSFLKSLNVNTDADGNLINITRGKNNEELTDLNTNENTNTLELLDVLNRIYHGGYGAKKTLGRAETKLYPGKGKHLVLRSSGIGRCLTGNCGHSAITVGHRQNVVPKTSWISGSSSHFTTNDKGFKITTTEHPTGEYEQIPVTKYATAYPGSMAEEITNPIVIKKSKRTSSTSKPSIVTTTNRPPQKRPSSIMPKPDSIKTTTYKDPSGNIINIHKEIIPQETPISKLGGNINYLNLFK